MAWSVPLVRGKTAPITVRAKPRSYSFWKILTLIRVHSGIPPFRLRDSQNTDPSVLEYRDVAIYLADIYPCVPHEELAEYFSVDFSLIGLICGDPLGVCNLRILSDLQQKIEKSLEITVPLNFETNRMLTVYEQYDLQDSVDRESIDGYFFVSRMGRCELADEDLRARTELEEYYWEHGLEFDEEFFCSNNGHSSRWNVCPFGVDSH